MSDATDLPLLEALHSTPARRYLSDTPIPEPVVWDLLDAAVRAPTGGNRQGWGWVVVTDPAVKEPIAARYKQVWDESYGKRRDEVLGGGTGGKGLSPASFRAAEHLAGHIAEAPVWVFPVLRGAAQADNRLVGSSIYGAVQHLLLAARAYGIGGVLTTFHTAYEDEVRELLGLPEDAATMALVPLGYPARGRWAQPVRRPLEEVVHWGAWGTRRPRPGAAG